MVLTFLVVFTRIFQDFTAKSMPTAFQKKLCPSCRPIKNPVFWDQYHASDPTCIGGIVSGKHPIFFTKNVNYWIRITKFVKKKKDKHTVNNWHE